MTRALLAIVTLVALASPTHADLDAPGRALLDPIRERALGLDALVARLRIHRSAHIADIGAGPGLVTLALARAVPNGSVLATDVRSDYLVATAARAKAAGLANVETRVVKADAPGLTPQSVDLAVLCQVDHYLADRRTYFAALERALRPGGRVVLVNYARYRDADTRAATELGWAQTDAWSPTPQFFVLVFSTRPAR